MLESEQWYTIYAADSDTNVLMDYLSHNIPLNNIIIVKLVVTYRKAIAKKLLYILNGRLIYLEPVTIFINHICHIIIPPSLRRVDFNLIHASPITSHMGK